MKDQKTMQTRCQGGFSIMWVPKLFLFLVKIKIFGPKMAFLAKYQHFWSIWFHARPKTMQTRCLGGFSVTWVPKLLLPPAKIRIFGKKKKAKFAPIYAFLGTYRPCRFIWCPVGWWLWRTGCISQDTSLLYLVNVKHEVVQWDGGSGRTRQI